MPVSVIDTIEPKNDGSFPVIKGSAIFTDGSVSEPSLSFASDPNLGLYRISTDLMGVSVGSNGLGFEFGNNIIANIDPLGAANVRYTTRGYHQPLGSGAVESTAFFCRLDHSTDDQSYGIYGEIDSDQSFTGGSFTKVIHLGQGDGHYVALMRLYDTEPLDPGEMGGLGYEAASWSHRSVGFLSSMQRSGVQRWKGFNALWAQDTLLAYGAFYAEDIPNASFVVRKRDGASDANSQISIFEFDLSRERFGACNDGAIWMRSLPATSGAPTRDSPPLHLVGAYWDGALSKDREVEFVQKMLSPGVSELQLYMGDTGSPLTLIQSFSDTKWQEQATWWIDFSAGDDNNKGDTSGTAIKTCAEFLRRVTQRPVFPQDTTINFVGSASAGDTIDASYMVTEGSTLKFQAVSSNALTGVAITAFSQNRGAGNPGLLTAAWTPASYIGSLITITSGTAAGYRCRVLKDLGGGQALVSPLSKENYFEWWEAPDEAFPAVAFPVPGDTFDVQAAPPTIYMNRVEFQAASVESGGYEGETVVFENLTLAAESDVFTIGLDTPSCVTALRTCVLQDGIVFNGEVYLCECLTQRKVTIRQGRLVAPSSVLGWLEAQRASVLYLQGHSVIQKMPADPYGGYLAINTAVYCNVYGSLGFYDSTWWPIVVAIEGIFDVTGLIYGSAPSLTRAAMYLSGGLCYLGTIAYPAPTPLLQTASGQPAVLFDGGVSLATWPSIPYHSGVSYIGFINEYEKDWTTQSDWYIKPSGDNLKRGNTSGTAIKTLAEFFRRVGRRPEFKVPVVVHVEGDLGSSDPIDASYACFGAGSLTIQSEETVLHSGTIVSYSADRTTNNPGTIEDADWVVADLIGKQIRITSGTCAGFQCRIWKDLGSNKAMTSVLSKSDEDPYYPVYWAPDEWPVALPSPGDTFDVIGYTGTVYANKAEFTGGVVIQKLNLKYSGTDMMNFASSGGSAGVSSGLIRFCEVGLLGVKGDWTIEACYTDTLSTEGVTIVASIFKGGAMGYGVTPMCVLDGHSLSYGNAVFVYSKTIVSRSLGVYDYPGMGVLIYQRATFIVGYGADLHGYTASAWGGVVSLYEQAVFMFWSAAALSATIGDAPNNNIAISGFGSTFLTWAQTPVRTRFENYVGSDASKLLPGPTKFSAGVVGSVTANVTRYLLPNLTEATTNVFPSAATPCNGLLQNLVVKAGTAPGGTDTYVVTVQVDGVDTSLTVTLTGTDTLKSTAATNRVFVAQGSKITFKAVASATCAAADVTVSAEF